MILVFSRDLDETPVGELGERHSEAIMGPDGVVPAVGVVAALFRRLVARPTAANHGAPERHVHALRVGVAKPAETSIKVFLLADQEDPVPCRVR